MTIKNLKQKLILLLLSTITLTCSLIAKVTSSTEIRDLVVVVGVLCAIGVVYCIIKRRVACDLS